MALEDLLERVVNALETNTVKLEQLTQETEALRLLRADAIETVKTAATAPVSDKKATSSKASTAKAAVQPDPEPEEESTTEETEEVIKTDTLSDAVKEYIGLAANDEAARKKNFVKVREIFSKVKATKRSEVPADKEAAVEKAIRKLIDEAQAENTKDDEDDLL